MKSTPSISICALVSEENNDFVEGLVNETLIRVGAEEIVLLCLMDKIPEKWNVYKDKINIVLINQATLPFLFFETGIEKPISEKYSVSSISEILNLGIYRCSKDWILLLNEDEKIEDLHLVGSICEELDREGSDFAIAPSYGMYLSTFRPRLVKGTGYASFVGVQNIQFLGSKKTTVIADKLCSKIVKIPKAFSEPKRAWRLHNALISNTDINPQDMLELALIASPHIYDSARLVKDYLNKSFYIEERSWACSVLGLVHEKKSEWHDHPHDSLLEALQWFQKAFEEWPNWKAALRICRIQFALKNWLGVLEAFDQALEHKDILTLVDPVSESVIATLSFVAEAYHQIGDQESALKTCEVFQALSPDKPGVKKLYEIIKGEST